jgi:plastocyanin
MQKRPLASILAIVGIALLSQGASLARDDADVSIVSMRFDPAKIEIRKGESITWTNNDDRDHTIEASDGSFKSGNLSRGKTYRYTFKKTGTYNYGCGLHPRMKGTVVVKE